MQQPYLEVTFRHGKPIAGYYYLPRPTKQKSYRTEKLSSGLLVDYNRAGRPIGIEITAPGEISLTVVNRVLRRLGQQPLQKQELAPLLAA
ncbi:MAG TPA: DUF2283 domain-containing protein [Candidatus Limnocylindrales bacterium]|nr:DUF2283 domain-containing protein [Candidatus Limnocylindrales bacterium]